MNAAQAPHIMVNGQPLTGAEGLSLAELLTCLGEPANEVATALNGEFIARERRDCVRLVAGDRLTFFKAIVGG